MRPWQRELHIRPVSRMFGWLRPKPKRPSYAELGARVASVIDAFIRREGFAEFSKGRLSVVVTTDYEALISAPGFARNSLVAVPLNELLLDLSAGTDGIMRHMAIDIAARIVVDRLPPHAK